MAAMLAVTSHTYSLILLNKVMLKLAITEEGAIQD